MRRAVMLLFILTACKHEALEIGPYLKWLNDPNNKLSVVRRVSGLKLKAKYLPEEYIRYLAQSRSADSKLEVDDSLRSDPENTVNILLTIAPDEEYAGNDIMMLGIRDYADYEKRFRLLNFNLNQIIRLQTDNGEYQPVFVSFENTYGLTDYRNVTIVFVTAAGQPPLKNAEYYDVVFEDTIFGTGTNHFVFDKKAIKKTPKLLSTQSTLNKTKP